MLLGKGKVDTKKRRTLVNAAGIVDRTSSFYAIIPLYTY